MSVERGTVVNIKIIYEDNHLLMVEKPPNMLSQGDSTGDPDLLGLLKEDIKRRYNKPGEVFLGLVHRLDRPVGGVMAFARTSKSASRLSEQIRKGSFKKIYLAVIKGMLEKSFGSLEHYLKKDESTNIVHVVPSQRDKGKYARLEYEVLSAREGLSLVKIKLCTGRAHQIRVQFSASGNPIFGDRKYGKEKDGIPERIALWFALIDLSHPTQKNTMRFLSAPPVQYPWTLFNGEIQDYIKTVDS